MRAARQLDSLFNPKSIAMIGASTSLRKWGFLILLNILKAGYKGDVYPVNPKQDSILGFKCYPNVMDIPEAVDLAVLTIPAAMVSDVIDDCGKKGVPNVVVITADFSETGPEGARLEKEIADKARSYGINLTGPNTMGIFSSESNLHALMPMIMPLHGKVSMFSQSGNVGVQMLDYGQQENVGFEKFVSSGNQAVLTIEDYLTYFAEDDKTGVILGYIEGVDENSDFVEVASRVTRKKPVLVMKGGRTEVGGDAASSHSGAMAGSTSIFRAVCKQTGIVEVCNTQELIDCAKAFAYYPLPKGNRVGIITRGGGWGVLAADACEENGLSVPQLPQYLIEEMDKLLPKYWNRKNPIDLVGTIANDPLPRCLELLAEWDGVDAVLALGSGFRAFSYQTSEEVTGPKELTDTMAMFKEYLAEKSQQPDDVLVQVSNMVSKTGKPIISVTIGSDYAHKEYSERYGIVSYSTPERAVRVLKHMVDYNRYLQSPQ
jgi:acetyl coenzyme A synthetase (ADP forming)-like protein